VTSTGDGAVDEMGRRATSESRWCVICGTDISRRRSDARHCSGACRAEASRMRAILNNAGSVPYSSVAKRLEKAQKRTSRLLGATNTQQHPKLEEPDEDA